MNYTTKKDKSMTNVIPQVVKHLSTLKNENEEPEADTTQGASLEVIPPTNKQENPVLPANPTGDQPPLPVRHRMTEITETTSRTSILERPEPPLNQNGDQPSPPPSENGEVPPPPPLDGTPLPNVWIYEGEAYDLTDFLKKHPGGEFFIGRTKNRDITAIVNIFHRNPEKVKKVLKKYSLGRQARPEDVHPKYNAPAFLFRDGFNGWKDTPKSGRVTREVKGSLCRNSRQMR